jgi:hypothetical protein
MLRVHAHESGEAEMATVDVAREDWERTYEERLAAEKTEREKDKRNTSRTNERVRAIEQVKRLYAVVMGFAIWSCITNAYQCGRKIWHVAPDWSAHSILAAQVVAFLSLVALFYLAAERMLDRKYLRRDSPIPNPADLLVDLASIGGPAIGFVAIANIFPSILFTSSETELLAGVMPCFYVFMWSLGVLYLADILLLLFQRRKLQGDANEDKENRKHYGWWIRINVCSILAIGLLIWFFDSLVSITLPVFSLNFLAAIILVGHLVRFCVDYWNTFSGYYPLDPLEP